MFVGQVISRWWQRYAAGGCKTPRQLMDAVRQDSPLPIRPLGEIPPLPDGAWLAPERLKSAAFIGTTGYLSQCERADWAEVDPRLKYWAALFVEYARVRGIPLYVHCARRGRAEQDRLRAQGRSRAPYGKSAHNIGEAVDIVHGLFHWDMNRQEWQMLHVLGRLALERVNARLAKADKLALTWGGDFQSLYDPAHWEITDFRNRLHRAAAVADAAAVHRTPRAILKEARTWAMLK